MQKWQFWQVKKFHTVYVWSEDLSLRDNDMYNDLCQIEASTLCTKQQMKTLKVNCDVQKLNDLSCHEDND